MNDIQKRIMGCLVGVAAGDAMGMPSSMMSPQTIRNTFGYIDTFLPAPKGHIIHDGLQAAEVTDDTQQTLLLADSLIAKRRVDPQDIAQRLIRWAEAIGAFDSMLIGPSSLRALHGIRNGQSVYEAGSVGDTNGAVMRIAAIGVYGKGDQPRTIDVVEKACLPTHNTNVAIAGASGVAMAIGLGLNGEDKFGQMIPTITATIKQAMQRGNIWYSASITERSHLALEIIEQPIPRVELLQRLYSLIGAGVQISETVPTCLALTKLVKSDPVEGILAAANLGGDCDTIGAITGAICGAISGIDAFPKDWIRQLSEVNDIDFEYYTNQLYDLIK